MFPLRLLVLRLLTLAAFLAFVGMLAYLQLGQGERLKAAAEKNRLRWLRAPAPRGVIYDRKGRVLATSVPARTAWLVPGEVPREAWEGLYTRLVALNVLPTLTEAHALLDEYQRYPSYLPVRLATGLTMAQVTRIEEAGTTLPGVYVREEPIRTYPGGSQAAHVLGYLREINADELQARAELGYRPGDRIGRAGVERAFEDVLRGTEGGEQVEVDALGKKVRELQALPPQPGQALTLTLNADIQQAAEAALAGHHGAAVVLDPHTGDILALASVPEYDANLMSGRITPQMLAWLRRTRAEMNIATSGLYAPGSIFKIITAATALEAGKVGQEYFICNGSYKGIHCWKRSGHDAVNLTEAIAHSCNVAFMDMAGRVGIEALAGMARRFGLGQQVGLNGIVSESAGVVPDPAWARKTFHRPWELGETLQVGMGQSSLTVTPLQSARVVAAIANGGKLVHPRLVRRIGQAEQPLTELTPIGLKPVTLQRITRGLRAVVGEGTAKGLDPTLRIAGKTGTAQNPQGEDHAWFAGFAPADAPQVAVVVLVEHGGHGGATAAPIAEAIIRTAQQGPPKPAPVTAPTAQPGNGG